MSDAGIGDELNRLVAGAKGALFSQAQLAELTYAAFDIAANNVQNSPLQEITLSYPVGWRADRQPVSSSWTYPKEELIAQYRYLAFHQLAVNGLFQLTAISEALLGDVVRALIRKYPHKLGGKRSMPLQAVLEASTLEEVHMRVADQLLNELSYKSPAEFAESLQSLLSINLLECPAFHKYVEVKASRDIFIHNRGIANEIYVRKSGSHQRVKAGMSLPADPQYFLESYEACLQLNEWLEQELHDRWHSSEFQARREPQLDLLPPSHASGVT